MGRWRLYVSLLILGFVLGPLARSEHPLREWTSSDGRSISAQLIHADAETVILRLRNGREASVEIEQLSEEDRAYVQDLRSQGLALQFGEIPEETQIDQNVDVKEAEDGFRTPNFRFQSESDVTPAFISEASRVFEGTLHAIDQLPLGLAPQPPEGLEFFQSLFMTRGTFDEELRDIEMHTVPGQTVAGVYISKRKEILVPYTSMGTTTSGSKISLRRTSDTSTLIHEITHQVMHDWLPIAPLWLSEGFAEYVAMIPYQNGRFEFRNAERGLKEVMEERYRGQSLRIIHPGTLIDARQDDWEGLIAEYFASMLLTYYFIHFDRGGQGEALAAYLHLIQQGRQDAESFVTEYNKEVDAFEKRRLAFNETVKAYNEAVTAYRAEIDAYNKRVDEFNEQLRGGVPEEERVKLGEIPQPPTPPSELEVPEMLKNNPQTGPIDLFAVSNVKGRPALYRGRDAEALAADMKAAFATIGIELSFQPYQSPKAPAPTVSQTQ